MIFNDIQSFTQAKNFIDWVIHSKNPYILPIKSSKIDEKLLFCSEVYTITIFLENYKRDLETEMRIREKTKKFFDFNEFYGLAYSMLKSLESLKSFENRYFHGKLSINTVVLCKNGVAKVIVDGERSIKGSHEQDLKDMADILIMIKSVIEVEDIEKTRLNEFIKELKESKKPLEFYISYIKSLKIRKIDKNKKNLENHENTLKSTKIVEKIENYMSFGENLPLNPINNTIKAKESYDDGSYYSGSIYNNQRHGDGTLVFSKGGVYKGEWYHGKMSGYGILYYSSGKVAYEGYWKDDLFEGKGQIINENIEEIVDFVINYKDFNDFKDYWKSYSGDFKGDRKDGEGCMVFRTGDKYIGGFKSNAIEGSGVFFRKDGTSFKGLWVNNRLIDEKS